MTNLYCDVLLDALYLINVTIPKYSKRQQTFWSKQECLSADIRAFVLFYWWHQCHERVAVPHQYLLPDYKASFNSSVWRQKGHWRHTAPCSLWFSSSIQAGLTKNTSQYSPQKTLKRVEWRLSAHSAVTTAGQHLAHSHPGDGCPAVLLPSHWRSGTTHHQLKVMSRHKLQKSMNKAFV